MQPLFGKHLCLSQEVTVPVLEGTVQCVTEKYREMNQLRKKKKKNINN